MTPRRMRPSRPVGKLAALVLLGALAGAWIGERAFRALERRRDPDGNKAGSVAGLYARRQPRPYVMFEYPRGLAEQVRPADRLRIFLLGGSTVAHGTLAPALEAELRSRGFP